ncbi:MAG: anhydro-N-acetylmuramic acid kinase [Cyanobacteriota bacterium]
MALYSKSKKEIHLEPKIVIGLMSGTSMDGIDAALVKIVPKEKVLKNKFDLPILEVETIASFLYPFPDEFRDTLNRMVESQTTLLDDICKVNFMLGELLAEACLEVVRSARMYISDVDLIGSHGQTMFHKPGNERECGIKTKSTFQIGEPSVIAQRTGVTTIADFRPRDIAAGGEGAPLVCFADLIFFSHPFETRLVQNIGGISNVTVIPHNKPPFAFDTGPGNILMNIIAQRYFNKECDLDGEIAYSGRIDVEWLEKVIASEPYYKLLPPKTTGRELFNFEYIQKLLKDTNFEKPEDILASFSALTAKTIANAYIDFIFPQYKPSCVILGGGGAYNPFLLDHLYQYLDRSLDFKHHEDFDISNKFKEAISFAILAYTTYYGIPNNVPSCTGASDNVVMGKIIPGGY